MIFVTVGTQDKEFKRLIEYVLRLKEELQIIKKEKILIQHGKTNIDEFLNRIQNLGIETVDFCNFKQIDENIQKSEIIISHAGVGTIMETLKSNKNIIVIPRLEKYKEHTNNHQLDIAKEFSKKGYIRIATNYEELKKAIENIEKTKDENNKKEKREKFKSNTKKFNKRLIEYIENI